MARRKKYKYVIITDESGKPMAWDDIGKQLAYCTNSNWQDEHHPVRFYTVAKAKRLIDKSMSSRRKRNPTTEFKYLTMPFELTYWQETRAKKTIL